MKKLLLALLIVVSQNFQAQTNLTEIEKSNSLCYVWGLMKYYHPVVSTGKFDWNKEFVNLYSKTEKIETQGELNEALLTWINSFENEKTKYSNKPIKLDDQKIFTKNVDFGWIDQCNFNEQLTAKINQIKDNAAITKHYASIEKLNNFVSFKNEKGFAGFDEKIKSNRVLYLASFWNAMKYWNVNIYLTDENWNQVLQKMQKDFIEADTNEKFEYAKRKLFSKLNDSHSDYNTDYLFDHLWNRFAPFGGPIINDSLVVTNLHNKTWARKDGIELRDVIYEIEGMSVKEYFVKKFKNLQSASNLNHSKNMNQHYLLLASNKDSIAVGKISKDLKKQQLYIHLNKLEEHPKEERETIYERLKAYFYAINDNIGYINLYGITDKQLSEAFKSFQGKKGIIIDLRNYPRNVNESDLAKYLYSEKKTFVKVLGPIQPSIGEYDMQAPLKLIKNPFVAGSKNSNYYKGKVVLLVNRSTISKAEYMAMAIQQAPNCVTVGEQTGGAVMNRIQFTLADKSSIDFTGMGAFYPDDTGVQRTGLKIDHVVQESAMHFNTNSYVEKAIMLIEE